MTAPRRPAPGRPKLLTALRGYDRRTAQLARLRASGLVAAKKDGSATRYSVTDPMLKNLLQVARQVLNRRLVGVRTLLRELDQDSIGRA